jgi:ribonuclease HI
MSRTRAPLRPSKPVSPEARSHSADRFLEELSETLDLSQTIKKLNMTEEQARVLLKSLIKKKPAHPSHRDLFEGIAPKKPHVTHRGAYTINVDGASRGNPGEAGAGAVIRDPEGNVVKRLKKYLGRVTNNVAEYNAILIALEAAQASGLSSVRILADSELMVKQLNGVYRVKSEGLKPLYERARGLIKGFKECKIAHVYREDNSMADALANEAIDSRKG